LRSIFVSRVQYLWLLALVALALPWRATAQTGAVVYDDALENGFQNWSWASVNLAATSPVHSGKHSIQVTYTAGYQGLYLAHANSSTVGFASITFWINGGSAGGQQMTIAGIRNGNQQGNVPLNQFINGGAVKANAWSQVTVPLSAIGLANVSDCSGFWLMDSTGGSQPTFYVDDVTVVAGTIPPVTNSAVTVSVDAAANRHAINPNIYGVAYATPDQLLDLNCPINRSGGNNTSRYNWQLNADNKGSDWYYESIGDSDSTPGARIDSFIEGNQSSNSQSMITIPMIGWIAKLGPNRAYLSSYSIKKYGAQTGHDPYFPDAGNGILSSTNKQITGNDPNDADVPSTSAFQAGWINHLVSTFGQAGNGGLKYYILDNEPSIWYATHRDVHPTGATMSEVLTKMEDYGGKVKAADPSALLVGPEEWGWSGYFFSGYDQQYGSLHGWSYLPDRTANGNMDYLPWLLSQLHSYDVAHGTRSLDVFTVHYYPQGGEYSSDTSPSTQLLRNRSTRSMWDPTYVDQSWINSVVQLIPRLKGWVAQYYPGLQVGLTEYSWGADSSLGGATAQADLWGIFGVQSLDLATRWTVPSSGTPAYNAMKLIRNYDSNRSGFGDVSVSASTANPDNLSSFAAQRSADGALTVLVVNKVLSGNTPVTVNLANFNAAGTAQVWQLNSTNVVTRLSDLPVSNSSIAVTVPAQSVTLLILPPAGASSPAPYTTPIYRINCGNAGGGAFSADAFYSGGVAYPTSIAVSTTGVVNAAPAEVYSFARGNNSVRGNIFSYAIPNLKSGVSYAVRLHFAELWYGVNLTGGAGSRIFNVMANGSPLLTNFDVYAAAGGPKRAVVKQALVTANSQGQIVLSFTAASGSPDPNAIVSGIEILQ
jgi:hypothetical protein